MAAGRFGKVIKTIREAEDLARTGAVTLDDGAAAIYFLWGRPSHAYIHEGETTLEGEEALKSIALQLSRPGRVAWKSKEVLQVETLRCSAEELLRTLEDLQAAPAASPEAPADLGDGWDGNERRRVEAFSYSLQEFPLLPTGAPLWADVPTNVVHLDVLIGTLPSVLITFESEGARGAGIVSHGEFHDALWVDSRGERLGREAWDLMMGSEQGSVSAFELDERLADAVPILWRSRIVARDMDKRWFEGREFLEHAASNGEDRAVIVATPTRVGIALYLRGEPVGCWTSLLRTPETSIQSMLDLMADRGEGAVSIIERIEEATGSFALEVPEEAPLEKAAPALSAEPPPAPPEPVAPEAPAAEVETPAEPVAPEVFAAAPEAPVADELTTEQPAAEQPAWPAEPAWPVEPAWQSETTTAPPAGEPAPDPWADLPSDPAAQTETAAEAPAAETGWGAEPYVPETPAPATEWHEEPAPPPAAEAPASPPPTAPVAGGFDFLGGAPQVSASPLFEWNAPAPAPTGRRPGTEGEQLHPGGAPRADYEEIVDELVAIGRERLGPDFEALLPIITGAERSAPGLRKAIGELRGTEVFGHSQEEISDVGWEMLLHIADRVTAA